MEHKIKLDKIDKDFVKESEEQITRELAENKWREAMEQILESDPYCGHGYYIHTFTKNYKFYHHVRLTHPGVFAGSTLQYVDVKDGMKVTLVYTLPEEEQFDYFKQGGQYESMEVWKFIEGYKNGTLKDDPSKDPTKEELRDIYRAKQLRGDTNITL